MSVSALPAKVDEPVEVDGGPAEVVWPPCNAFRALMYCHAKKARSRTPNC